MKLLKYASVKLSLGLILGILIGSYFNPTLIIAIAITFIFLIALGILFTKEKNTSSTYFGILMLLTSISIGVLSFSISRPTNYQSHYTQQYNSGTHTLQLKITKVLKSTNLSNKYIARIKSINKHFSSGEILLSVSKDSLQEKLFIDQEITTHTKIKEILPPLNPYQFNYKNYLKNLGIYHQLQISTNEYVIHKKASTTLLGIAAKIRATIILKLQAANFGEEEFPIIEALLLGERNHIAKNTYTNYKNAGAIHILALSGLHIGILLLLLQFILKPLELLPKGNTIKLVLIILILWCFALLAGFSASIIRAVTMFSFITYAQFLNRPTSIFNIVALSLFFILLVNPMFLFQVGFQMSYAAVFAIVWIYPILQKIWFPNYWILKKGWQLLAVSIAAQLGVLPVSLYYFHQFPGLFFISNLAIIPFLGVLLGLGILIILLAVLNILPNFLTVTYDACIALMNSIVKWVAQQEAFLFTAISFDAVQLILSYILIISMIIAITGKSFKKWAVFLFAIISFQCYNLFLMYKTQQAETILLLHESKNTILLHQSGEYLTILNSQAIANKSAIQDYKIAKRIKNIQHQSLKNSYHINTSSLLIIDSLGMYPNKKADIVLLTKSPKINLERLIDSITPNIIIADGSNYKTSINRWKATCKKRKLPFHYTGEQGAYYFNLDSY